MIKYLLILIVLFAPTAFVYTDYTCAISFDQNPITSGQGTYLRWSVSLVGNPYMYQGTMSMSSNVWLDIQNIGVMGYWGSWYESSRPPTSGSVWVAPGASTSYSGTVNMQLVDVGTTVYSYCPATLIVNPAANCTFNGNTVNNGSSVTAYQTGSVPFGNSCVSQSRTCTNGTLSGSYTFSSCTPAGIAACNFTGYAWSDTIGWISLGGPGYGFKMDTSGTIIVQ